MAEFFEASRSPIAAPLRAEREGMAQPVLAALAAAGDVAYAWDIESDQLVWHGALAALGFANAALVASGQAFAGRINPEDLVQRQQLLHAHYARGTRYDC